MLRAIGLIALIYLFFNYLPEILETADKCLERLTKPTVYSIIYYMQTKCGSSVKAT